MRKLSIFGTFAIALAGVTFATSARAECSRDTLQALADTYVKAQTDGRAGMLPLASGASYAENDQAMAIGAGVLAGPLKVDFTRSSSTPRNARPSPSWSPPPIRTRT